MSYAKLGNTCCTSMEVLSSNVKYIPLDDPIYKIYYTKTQQLPESSIDEENDILKYPEDIKKFKQPREESCCNKNK